MELSIDTSTRYASVGLSREGEAIAELTWRSAQNHSVELANGIRHVMSQPKVNMDQLKAIFVARGPGGFSALRVGMSTAKALAVALNIPLVSVDTLEVEATPYLGLGLPICAIIEAGRERVYIGRYKTAEQDEKPVYDVVNHKTLGSEQEATLFCGEGVRTVANILIGRLGKNALLADVPPPTRSVGILAHLAFNRWQTGATDDPETAQPLYLRSAQIDMARRTWIRS